MNERSCALCGANIEHRHGNARTCESCASDQRRKIEAIRTRAPRRRRQRVSVIQARCQVCNVEFKVHRTGQVACSNACGQYLRKNPGFRYSPRTCPTCGVSIEHRSRKAKYCTTACRPTTKQAGRRVIAPLSTRHRELRCGHCNGTFTSTRSSVKFCSRRCETREYNAPGSYVTRIGRACEHCGTRLGEDERVNRRHCSDRCTVLANQLVRRARRKGLPVERVSRIGIFERDGWMCHVCQGSVDPQAVGSLSPSLDHVIPYADPMCPGHVWENLALAHRKCNIGKNGRTRPEDHTLYAALRAQRGGDSDG